MKDKQYGSIIQDALHWKYAGIPLSMGESYLSVNWPEGFSIPSIKEVDEIIDEYRDYADKQSYKQKRLIEFPQIINQLEMIWDAMDSGSLPKDNDFYTSIKAVKDKYPKPE